jgi:cell division septal protein FtsQ
VKGEKEKRGRAAEKVVKKAKKALPPEEKKEKKEKKKKGGIGGLARAVLSLSLLLAVAVTVGRGVRMGYRRVHGHIIAAHRLQTVHIVGNKILSKDAVLRLLQLPRPIALEEIDVRLCRRRLLACPQILSAQVERAYPNGLRLRIGERVPVLRLPRLESGETPLVAADGMVFLAAESANWQHLPLLRGMTGVVGKKLDGIPELCQALRSAAELDAPLAAAWRSVALDPGSLDHPDCFEVQCPEIQHLRLRLDDLPRQLEELRYLLDDLRRKKQLPAGRVDLTIPGKAYVKANPQWTRMGE